MKVLLLLAVLVPSVTAQLRPGTYLALTGGPPARRSVQQVDRFAGTAEILAITGLPLATEEPVATLVEAMDRFLVLTVDTARRESHLYRVGFRYRWTAVRLTTHAMSPPATHLARIGSTLYLAGGSLGGAKGDAMIYRLPDTGGAPQAYVPLGRKYRIFTASGRCGPLVAHQGRLHCFMQGAPDRDGVAHWVIDPTRQPPGAVRVGAPLPVSRRYNRSFQPVGARFDPATHLAVGGLFVIGGQDGEVLWRSPTGLDIHHAALPGPVPALLPNTQRMTAMALDTDTGAVLLGDGAGHLEELIWDGNGRWRTDILHLLKPDDAPVTSLEYIPAGATYRRVTAGCPHGAGRGVPLAWINGLPTRTNWRFALTLESPAPAALVRIGTGGHPVALGPFGAPGCLLWPSGGWVLAGRRSGATWRVGLPIPPYAGGMVVTVQWLAIDPSANALGLALSDGCRLKVR